MIPPGLLVTSQGWGVIDLPLRAAFSPAHPLACRDMPLALARASRDRALREHRRSSASTPPLFCEQKGHLAAPYALLCASYPLHYFIFKGSLVDPRLRASNEHILIVRVPRAGRRPGCPIPFPSSPVPQSNAQRLSSPRRLGPSRSIRSAHGTHARVDSSP